MPWYLDLRAPQLLGERSCSQACASAQTISTEQLTLTMQLCYSGSLGRSASAEVVYHALACLAQLRHWSTCADSVAS